MQITSSTQEETENAAQNLAKELKGGEIIALYGTLGMGKTVFARSLIRNLTKDETLEVPSPTFTLVQTYDSDKGIIYHFDCYRLEDPEEIYELGWEDALSGSIVILEWPEKIAGLIPPKRLDISFSGVDNKPEQRQIQIKQVG